jgi:ribosomal-protein-alanine N-acetyltransferase
MEAPAAIRPAGLRDLFAVADLERACFGRDAWGLLDLVFALAGPGVRLKAVAAGRLVGFVVGDPRPREGFAWIATIGVHPDYRRRGLGARLLAEVEARLTQPRLKLTVRQSNLAAIALYRKFGYEQVAVWQRYYAAGEAGIVMEKARRQPAEGSGQ